MQGDKLGGLQESRQEKMVAWNRGGRGGSGEEKQILDRFRRQCKQDLLRHSDE